MKGANTEKSFTKNRCRLQKKQLGRYFVAHGESLMDYYFPRLPDAQQAADTARRADIALLSTNPNGPGVTLIDVTIAAHNSQHANLDFTVGGASLCNAQRKHTFYNQQYDTSSTDTKLVIFAIETSSHLHSEARQFLKDQIAASAPHNPGLEFGNILKTISVSVLTARARGIYNSFSSTKLTLDHPPTYPFIGGPLAVPAPPAFLSSIQMPRHDAVPSLHRRHTPVAAVTHSSAPTSLHPPDDRATISSSHHTAAVLPLIHTQHTTVSAPPSQHPSASAAPSLRRSVILLSTMLLLLRITFTPQLLLLPLTIMLQPF